MSNEQINSLQNLKRKKPLFDLGEGTAAETMAKNNTVSSADVEKERLSVHISVELEKEFKVLSKRLGITVSELLNDELKEFFVEGTGKRLLNDYTDDESLNRGYNLDAPVKQQLDEYCATNKRTKRFAVEAILSELIRKYK